MYRVQTGSRLHFGFLSLPGQFPAADPAPRAWGGAGLMIESPRFDLRAIPADTWSADSRLADRVLHFASTLCATLTTTPFPLRFRLAQISLDHCGLGTGTQLGLAVASLLNRAYGLGLTVPELARRVRRGARSAIGVHGFEHGGFLVEAGKRSPDEISPLIARVRFPEDWPLLLIVPSGATGLHGPEESRALEELGGSPHRLATERLSGLLVQGMLPALVERDYAGFGEAVYEYNRLVGEVFQSVQGGIYTHAASDAVVQFLRENGVPAVGQSSWGPALFAVVSDWDRVSHVAGAVQKRFGLSHDDVWITRAKNSGAVLING